MTLCASIEENLFLGDLCPACVCPCAGRLWASVSEQARGRLVFLWRPNTQEAGEDRFQSPLRYPRQTAKNLRIRGSQSKADAAEV